MGVPLIAVGTQGVIRSVVGGRRTVMGVSVSMGGTWEGGGARERLWMCVRSLRSQGDTHEWTGGGVMWGQSASISTPNPLRNVVNHR